jgi:hypothetical protein
MTDWQMNQCYMGLKIILTEVNIYKFYGHYNDLKICH